MPAVGRNGDGEALEADAADGAFVFQRAGFGVPREVGAQLARCATERDVDEGAIG